MKESKFLINEEGQGTGGFAYVLINLTKENSQSRFLNSDAWIEYKKIKSIHDIIYVQNKSLVKILRYFEVNDFHFCIVIRISWAWHRKSHES